MLVYENPCFSPIVKLAFKKFKSTAVYMYELFTWCHKGRMYKTRKEIFQYRFLFSVLVLHGSGCHSLSSSSDSNHGTSSLTCLEITALCEAIKEIPEISPSSENTNEIKSEWTENETQTATCDFDIWNDHRMSPASRSVLKKIDALFYRPKTDSSP